MVMRKQLRLITAALGLAAGGAVFFHQSSAIMAQTDYKPPVAAKTHEIGIVLTGGKFFFEPNKPIEINAGDSIIWVPQGGEHQLAPVDPNQNNLFEPTEDFTKDSPPEKRTRTFKTPAVINYLCNKHPATMKQKITVMKPAKS